MVISTNMVKEVRDRTNAGIIECKKALNESAGDIDKAIEILRKKNMASAAKKSDRNVSEGVVAIKQQSSKAVMVEVLCETDFVARSETFQQLTVNIVESIFNDNNVDNLKLPEGQTIEDGMAKLGENIKLGRVHSIATDKKGIIASYIHNSLTPNIGKIGVLVALNIDIMSADHMEFDSTRLSRLGKNLAMHIAATNPKTLSIDQIPKDELQKEREIAYAQVAVLGKPENVVNKIVEGKLNKFFEEVVLLEQFYVIDTTDKKMKISELLDKASKEIGAKITIGQFVMIRAGEAN